MSPAERVRTLRDRRRARGLCAYCAAPSDYGYACRRCAKARSRTILISVRRYRATHDFLAWWRLLAENRCVVCGQPKTHFHPLRHRQCQRGGNKQPCSNRVATA